MLHNVKGPQDMPPGVSVISRYAPFWKSYDNTSGTDFQNGSYRLITHKPGGMSWDLFKYDF